MKPSQNKNSPHGDALRQRAEAFIARAIPSELRPHYVSGSIADIVIASCARAESIDPELLEIADLAAQEYDDAIKQARTQELKDYYADCQAIIRAIVARTTS